MLRRSFLLLVVFLLVALPLAAQQPIGYLAEFKITPGSEGDLIDLVKKYDKPMLDGLMADGTVLAWGLDAVVVHREDGATHMIWWVTADYAGMDKVFAGFEKVDEQVSDADDRKLRAAIKSHHDHILRSIILNVSEESSAAHPYTTYSSVKVKRGKGSDWRKLFEKYNQPVLDKLVADGAIIGYGVDVEDIHTEDPGWRWIWVVAPNLAATDTIRAAFRADRQGRSEEERAAISHRFRSLTVAGAHRDYLFRTILMGGQ